ncbi:MAG: mechanosensitive ion channel family protein [Clostridiales bacterium]|nr:mechanosensitive ion channel family protein [Clostridiales bacterium]
MTFEESLKTGIDLAATPAPDIAEATSADVIETVSKHAEGLITGIPVFVTRLAIAAFVIFIGCIIIRIGRRMISRIVDVRGEKNMKSIQQMDTVRSLVTSIFNYVLYFIIITVVLGVFGVDISSILAVAGVGGIAIGFGAQTLVKDVISGFFIWMEGSIAVGDIVEINGLMGEVESIAIRTTVIRNVNGNVYSVPNGDIRTVTNMSREFKRALVDIRCPYDVPIERLTAILRDEMEIAAKEVEGLDAPPDVMSILNFEPDAVILRLSAKCPVKENWRIERELRSRVKMRFEREGIDMPHYQRPVIQ